MEVQSWTDLLIRMTLSDVGNEPRTSMGLSASPDVIPYGTTPVPDPVAFFTSQPNFARDLGQNVIPMQSNDLYVRGKNLFSQSQQGQMYTYVCPGTLTPYPNQWRNHPLSTSSGAGFINVSAGTNQPFATPEPFVWVPEELRPGQAYTLVSRVSTAQNPNPIPSITNCQDLALWLTNTGGLGIRNVLLVEPAIPELTFSALFDQGDEEALISFVLSVVDAEGAVVSFSSGTPINGKPVALPPTNVTQTNQTFVVQVTVPARWTSLFLVNYINHGMPPGPNFQLSLRAGIVTESDTGPSRLIYLGSANVVGASGSPGGGRKDRERIDPRGAGRPMR